MHPITIEIQQLENEKTDKINDIVFEYAEKIKKIQQSCPHKYEDGISAIPDEYSCCYICGKWV